MRFEWAEAKAAANRQKNGVSFEEACTLFEDLLYIIFADPDHSEAENRFIILGVSVNGRLIVVSFAERPDSTRLISAREATRSERELYEEDH